MIVLTSRPMSGTQLTEPVPFRAGDRIELRRPHPCGGRAWDVERVGADLRLRCVGCGHRVHLERRTAERRLVGFVHRGPEVAPR